MKLIYFLPMVVLLSCSKHEDRQNEQHDCDDQGQASISINNYADFLKYSNPVTISDAEYLTYHNSVSGHTAYGVKATLKNICNSDKPLVDFTVNLNHSDSIGVASGLIQEDSYYTDFPISSIDKKYFHKSLTYDFESENSTGIISVSIEFQFLTQGSPEADSTYFFSNLNFMSCNLTAHKKE